MLSFAGPPSLPTHSHPNQHTPRKPHPHPPNLPTAQQRAQAQNRLTFRVPLIVRFARAPGPLVPGQGLLARLPRRGVGAEAGGRFHAVHFVFDVGDEVGVAEGEEVLGGEDGHLYDLGGS